jgi:hypothetical protein
MAQRVRPVQWAQRVQTARQVRLVRLVLWALKVSPDLRDLLGPMARHFTHNYSPQAVTSPCQPVLMRYSWSVSVAAVAVVAELVDSHHLDRAVAVVVAGLYKARPP